MGEESYEELHGVLMEQLDRGRLSGGECVNIVMRSVAFNGTTNLSLRRRRGYLEPFLG